MKFLITDTVHPLLIKGLQEHGQTDYLPGMTYEEVREAIPAYEGLIMNSKVVVDAEFLDLAENLQWIGRLGSGMDTVDMQAAGDRGVVIDRSPEGNANAVGEHTIGMLLALFNKFRLGDAMVRSGDRWNRESARGRELDGQTVGVIGCGHTGPAFIQKLGGFDVEVLVYDRYKEDLPALHPKMKQVDPTTLISTADIVSLHIPLTKDTHQMADEVFFRQMKRGSIFINTSRGQVVELKALVRALESGHLTGACLDVFENEKPETYSDTDRAVMEALAAMDHVVLTPHVAGWTYESKEKIARVLLNKFDQFRIFF